MIICPFSSVCLHENPKGSVTLNAAPVLFLTSVTSVGGRNLSYLMKCTLKPTPPTPENLMHRVRRHQHTHTLLCCTHHFCCTTSSKNSKTNKKSYIVFHERMPRRIHPLLLNEKTKGHLVHLQYLMKCTNRQQTLSVLPECIRYF